MNINSYNSSGYSNQNSPDPRRRLILFVGLIVSCLVVMAFAIATVTHRSSTSNDALNRDASTTTISSSLTGTTDTLAVTYGGDSDANFNAVKEPYRVFGADSLPVPANIKTAVKELVPPLLRTQVTPTYATTYIQVDARTVKCDSSGNCTMGLYIDSPETYFKLALIKVNGNYVAKLTEQPWEGVRT